MIPSQTDGENTSRAAQLVTSSMMLTASFRVPVSQAATGTSVQARPRIPAASPRRCHATQLTAAPMRVSTSARAAQVVLSMLISTAAGIMSTPAERSEAWSSLRTDRHGVVCKDAGCARSRTPASPATWVRSTPDWRPRWRRTTQTRTTRRRTDAVLAVLQDARLLVPVVAMLGEVEYDDQGLAHDKTSDMAAVLMTGRDGRTALLAFTGTAALQALEPRGAPGPGDRRQAAQAAIQDEAAALLVDVAGPVMFVVEGDGPAVAWRGSRWSRRLEERAPSRNHWIGEPPGCALEQPCLVPLCLTDRSRPPGQDRSDKRRPPPTRIDRRVDSGSTGRRVKVTGIGDRCRRTSVT